MTTLTIELPEEEISLFKDLLKKLNGKVISVSHVPNKETLKAMNELKEGKGIRVKNVDELLKLI